jgi:hypothetical protein
VIVLAATLIETIVDVTLTKGIFVKAVIRSSDLFIAINKTSN